MAKEIIFVTGNPYKLASAKETLAKYGFEVVQKDMETPELQADDSADIAKYSAKWASEKLNKPIICTDASWSITAIGGFPGPYMKYVGSTISTKGILKLMEGEKNREIIFKEAIAYCAPGKEPIVEAYTVKGKLVEKPLGESDKRWAIDSLFVPDGYTKSIYHMSKEERNKVFSATKTWGKIAEKIKF